MTPTQTHYRITKMVGEGAFGTVYEAERIGEGISRRVAMKLLHAVHAGRVPLENRLRDEARMLSLINHRAIVRVDDLIRVDNAWCVVMEFVAGADLRNLLDYGPVPPRAALQIAEEIASALHAAYTQMGPEGNPLHLVHRDIKPENIRLTAQGEVKLLDFGIARADFHAREAATQQGGMGTFVYMSAERFRGEDTHAGDVYALGVTLFELLTAVPPGSSAGDSDRHPPGRTLRDQWAWLESLDAALLHTITEMMADEPEDRPTSRECARTLSEIRGRMHGEVLEDWAERALPAATGPNALPRVRSAASGPRANSTILQVGQTVGAPQSTPVPQTSAPWAVLGISAVAAIAIAVFVAVLIGWWGWSSLEPQQAANTPQTEPAATTSVHTPAAAVPAAPLTLPASSATEPAVTPSDIAPKSPEKPLTSAGSPRPAPASAPAPIEPPPRAPAAPAESSAPPTTGTLRVTGAMRVTLDGPDPSSRPGTLIPGKYSATVEFADGTTIVVNTIRVIAGHTTQVRCDASFATCAVSDPE